MRYIFLDETYPCQGTTKIQEATKNIVMAGWTVEQHRFNLNAHRLPELFRTPVLDQIASLFQTLDARALIGKATLDSILFRPGEIDATDDIAAMARRQRLVSLYDFLDFNLDFGIGRWRTRDQPDRHLLRSKEPQARPHRGVTGDAANPSSSGG